jgi:hypothetical protein
MLRTPIGGGVMPFKSKAQRRKFAQLLVEGKIEPDTFEEWNRSTGKKVLPERLHPAKSSGGKSARPKKAARKTTTKRAKRATSGRTPKRK